MEKKISTLVESLETLKATIDRSAIPDDGFQAHGWNQVHLTKDHIVYLISNQTHKLKSYGSNGITKGLHDTIDNHIQKINQLNATAQSYFTNNAQHLLYFVPVTLLTLQAVFSDIDYELFSYENIQDKKLLPRGLAARLRSTKVNLEKLDKSSEDLKGKITLINEAHEAAESLPTDLATLQEARLELSNLIETANKELSETKKELSKIKEEAAVLKNEAKKATDEIEALKGKAHSCAAEASKLVEECDDALQITTTQGLAAGFDQKAEELKKSIWIWIIGLLVALLSGAWIGAERVSAFTVALTNELTAGQAILHTIMSVFSIGGPLWLAWISTQQINQRFKLSEDYSYKATVAKSFTGFKKSAERFNLSTEERLFNSTLDRFDEMPLRLIGDKDYNSPWHEFIDSDAFKTATSMFPTLATEAGRFASKAKLRKKPKHSKATPTSETKDQPEEA